MIATSHRSCKQNFLSKGLHSTSFPTAKVFMDAGDILPAGDYLETNLHPIWVWGARGGGGGGGGGGVGGEGLGFGNFSSRFNLQNQTNLLVLCRTGAIWSLQKRALGLGRRIIFPLFYLVGITPVM